MTSKMDNKIFKHTVLLISCSVLLISCSTANHFMSKDVITKACDLKTHLNDTIIVHGTYSKCVEYESFQLIKNDSCRDSFNMHLIFSDLKILQTEFKKLQGCNQIIELRMKGIVRKDLQSYGHLGSNNAEFEVLEIIEFGEIKTRKK